MCALIAMCVYSTEQNKKDECLSKTLDSLSRTVDFDRHRLILSINGQTEDTEGILIDFDFMIERIIANGKNLGTAEAINKVLTQRKTGEHVVKMDDDVVIYQGGWVDLMEEAISRDPQIGIIGLKRRDLIQTTWHHDPNYRSELVMLPHEPGQRWITVERTPDIIGTATMFNSALLDKVGYSRQFSRYGFEDNLMCHRAHLSGFYNCFLVGVDIEHIDPGTPEFQAWKQKESGEAFETYKKFVHDLIQGKESVYYNPFVCQ